MRRFNQYVTEAELDQLVALYAPDALFVPEPGVQHRGRDAIRAALAALLELSPQMEARVAEVHLAGDTALVIVDWTLQGTAPDGSAVAQHGRSADVLRRESDGTWSVLIDHP
jgi:uncharacterized protein (TIGR02246 family)